MSHDLWASFATSELARLLVANPDYCFNTPPTVAGGLSSYATGASRGIWPYEDGVVVLEQATASHKVAVEFKRQNEGVHGMLTALGQSLAYLDKGFAGAILVLPDNYTSHARPGEYMTEVIDNVVHNPAIGVFTYQTPDLSNTSPFAGKLHIRRTFEVDTLPVVPARIAPAVTETQWIHLREGSSTPDAFFKYLQTAKTISAGPVVKYTQIPMALRRAVNRLDPGADPLTYLSNTVPGRVSLHDEVWRQFWFDFVATPEVMKLWTNGHPPYVLNDVATKLLQANGINSVKFFSGKSNSIKNRIISRLNAGMITENQAWEEFAGNMRNRAHSFREDIDSGLEGIGMLGEDGRPTDLGYRFVNACERAGGAESGVPRSILLSAILKYGSIGAWLHYVYRLSESEFRANPMSFAPGGAFNQAAYLQWIERKLVNDLHVMRKVSARGGVARQPFQAELAILRKFGLVAGFRIGVGLEINWPAVQEAISFPID